MKKSREKYYTKNEHAQSSGYNIQLFMYKCPMTGHCHPPLNEMVTSYERIYGDKAQYKHPPQTSEDVQTSIYWCLGSEPCLVLRCTFKFLILVNGLAGPLLHPATLHGKGPTLSELPAQVLKWSSKLFCLVNPSLSHPLQTPFFFPASCGSSHGLRGLAWWQTASGTLCSSRKMSFLSGR